MKTNTSHKQDDAQNGGAASDCPDSAGSVQPLTKAQAIVITGFTGYAACSMSEIHEDVEKRLGRPVWTHQFADEEVRKEMREAYRADFVAMCPKDSFSQNNEKALSEGCSAIVEGEDFTFTDILGGFAEGITRRDPSPVIRVGTTYHVWYSRSTVTIHGYTATIWHATSNDGHDWTERGQALGRGAVGTFDEHAVFTPSILVFKGRYYLSYTAVPEPFYNGAAGQPGITPTAIGLAVADSPDGPWQRVGTDPILTPSADSEQFDSLRVDDTCFVVREGRIWMYYKGRGVGRTPAQTKMGLVIAGQPEGPYQRVPDNPVVDGGHEVCVWPSGGGIASLQCEVGPCGNTLQFAADGRHFTRIADVIPPKAPGPFRADHYEDNADMQLTWGVCMREGNGWAWLQRFERIVHHTPTSSPPPAPEEPT